MKVNKELFDEFVNGKVAVNTKTLDEYNKLMSWLEENTESQWAGKKPTELVWFQNFREYTCIRLSNDIHIGYSCTSYYIDKGIKVISFEELFKPNPFYLMEVGYKIIIKNKFQEREYYMCDEKYVDDVKEDVLTLGCDIVAIYKPKYNGVKTIEDPKWELVWERKEKLYALSIPCEYQSSCDEFEKDYLYVEGYIMHITEGLEEFELCKFHLFTQKEIDNLPNQKFIQSLNKEVYKGE